MDAGSPRILVLKPSSLGDVVHTLPAVAALRKHWPQSEISWLINPEWAPLLEQNPDVDRTIIFPRKKLGGLRGLVKIPGWLASLGELPPDWALDFQGLLRTALIARYLGSKKIVGLSDAREGAGFFYQQTVPLPRQPMHAVDRYLRLAGAVGAMEVGKPLFSLPKGEKPAPDLPDRFVLLHPFSRGVGKSLNSAAVLQFCQGLAPTTIVLVGGDQEIQNLPGNVINLLGKTTLHELIWLTRRAAFTVSVDSGPMHIASALTDRLLSIHTWSNPLLVGPYNRENWISKDGKIQKMGDYRPASGQGDETPDLGAMAQFVLAQLA